MSLKVRHANQYRSLSDYNPAMSSRPHIFDQSPDSLTELCLGWGMPAYRAKQVLEWVYHHGVTDPYRMTNLPQVERARLAETIDFVLGGVLRHQLATDGTQKLLIDWSLSPSPGQSVRDSDSKPGSADSTRQPLPVIHTSDTPNPKTQTECVMIPAEGRSPRRTACISSQIGCPVGCRFCASGLGGLDGNLTAGQIVQQVWQLGRLPGVDRISHVVFMGMGEPLSNFAQVIRALKTITADWGLGISARRVTVSTVGLPAQIRRLAGVDLPITLAISLHAPNDALRRQLIPWAESVTIRQLIDAGRFFFDKTGREVTLEYILLGGVNDQPEHARELATVARQLRSNVNLIRYNEVAGLPYRRPTDNDVLNFQRLLRSAGVNCHIRASRGRDIAAACGQLRHEHSASSPG